MIKVYFLTYFNRTCVQLRNNIIVEDQQAGLVCFVGDPGFVEFPVNFDLAISQVRRHSVLESPSPGVSDSLLAGVARPYSCHRHSDHRST